MDSLIIVDISPEGTSPGFNLIPIYVKAMMDIQPSGSSLHQVRKQVGEQLNKIVQVGYVINLRQSPYQSNAIHILTL